MCVLFLEGRRSPSMTGRHLKVESEAGTSASFVNFSKHRREHTNKQTKQNKKRKLFLHSQFSPLHRFHKPAKYPLFFLLLLLSDPIPLWQQACRIRLGEEREEQGWGTKKKKEKKIAWLLPQKGEGWGNLWFFLFIQWLYPLRKSMVDMIQCSLFWPRNNDSYEILNPCNISAAWWRYVVVSCSIAPMRDVVRQYRYAPLPPPNSVLRPQSGLTSYFTYCSPRLNS